MGSHFAEASWNAITGAYYTGYGSGEGIWLLLSIGLCVGALLKGAIHEGSDYRKFDKH